MSKHQPIQPFKPAINRIADVMAHSNRYAFHGVGRLAQDARVSAASVSRLIHGKQNPSFLMVARLTGALERTLGCHIDPRDLVAENGEFLQLYVCSLLPECSGCLPTNAYDEFGDLKPAFSDVRPGAWVTSRYPRGFEARKGGL